MTTTRTITVRDHEVSVRTVDVPDTDDAERSQPFTAITGGRRTAAYTAAMAIAVVALALTPALMNLFH